MNKLSFAISCIIYAVYISGILLTFWGSISALIRSYTLRGRLRKKGSVKKQNPIISYLEKLLLSATGKQINPVYFASALLLIFIILFVLCYINYTILPSLFISCLCAALPVLTLVSKSNLNRTKSSGEGIIFLSELYRQYRIENKNIYQALENTAVSSKDYPVCAKQSSMLLLKLRSSADPLYIKKACDDFAFALGSAWGKTAANCIALAASSGTDISAGLTDITEQLKTAKQLAEERKRLNSESMRMTLILVPLLYVLSIIACTKYIGMSLMHFLKNQFFTPEGLLFFLLTLVLFLLNLILINTVSSTKLDF